MLLERICHELYTATIDSSDGFKQFAELLRSKPMLKAIYKAGCERSPVVEISDPLDESKLTAYAYRDQYGRLIGNTSLYKTRCLRWLMLS